jgi:ABC-type transporter Mla subunit MlaD
MERDCDRCGQTFAPASKRGRFCSVKCRTQATRARATGQPESIAAKPKRTRKPKADAQVEPDSPIGTLGAVITELTDAGRLNTSAGQAAVALASRIDAGAESSSGLAALTREMRAAMAEATANVAQAGDALDELRAKREARRAG